MLNTKRHTREEQRGHLSFARGLSRVLDMDFENLPLHWLGSAPRAW